MYNIYDGRYTPNKLKAKAVSADAMSPGEVNFEGTYYPGRMPELALPETKPARIPATVVTTVSSSWISSGPKKTATIRAMEEPTNTTAKAATIICHIRLVAF